MNDEGTERRSRSWRGWRQWYDIFAHRVLHIDDRPHRISLGVAIGIFVAFTPTIGLQTPICFALAWLLGANKVVGLPLVWISNPATFVPIYYPSYLLGCRLMGNEPVNRTWFSTLAPDSSDPIIDQLHQLMTKFVDVAGPLWIGCIVVASLLSLLTYTVMWFAVKWYRTLQIKKSSLPEQD